MQGRTAREANNFNMIEMSCLDYSEQVVGLRPAGIKESNCSFYRVPKLESILT